MAIQYTGGRPDSTIRIGGGMEDPDRPLTIEEVEQFQKNPGPPTDLPGIWLQCENGHTMFIGTSGFDKEWAVQYASLLDGKSSMFVHPPRTVNIPESKVGKCGICGAWLNSQVVGY